MDYIHPKYIELYQFFFKSFISVKHHKNTLLNFNRDLSKLLYFCETLQKLINFNLHMFHSKTTLHSFNLILSTNSHTFKLTLTRIVITFSINKRPKRYIKRLCNTPFLTFFFI